MSKQANVVLSLDFGTKKIGVCIAETYTGQSSPLPVLKNDEYLFDNLDKVINEWLPNFCIIGKPKEMKKNFKEAYKDFFKNSHNLRSDKSSIQTLFRKINDE